MSQLARGGTGAAIPAADNFYPVSAAQPPAHPLSNALPGDSPPFRPDQKEYLQGFFAALSTTGHLGALSPVATAGAAVPPVVIKARSRRRA